MDTRASTSGGKKEDSESIPRDDAIKRGYGCPLVLTGRSRRYQAKLHGEGCEKIGLLGNSFGAVGARRFSDGAISSGAIVGTSGTMVGPCKNAGYDGMSQSRVQRTRADRSRFTTVAPWGTQYPERAHLGRTIPLGRGLAEHCKSLSSMRLLAGGQQEAMGTRCMCPQLFVVPS